MAGLITHHADGDFVSGITYDFIAATARRCLFKVSEGEINRQNFTHAMWTKPVTIQLKFICSIIVNFQTFSMIGFVVNITYEDCVMSINKGSRYSASFEFTHDVSSAAHDSFNARCLARAVCQSKCKI